MNKRTCTMPECNRAHRARGLCASHYNQQHAPDRHAKKLVPCAWCGVEALKNSGGNKARRPVCSDGCRAKLTPSRPAMQSELPADHWARWFGKTCEWPRYPLKPCSQCGDPFLPKSTNAKYCSRRCMYQWHDRKAGVRSQADTASMVRFCVRCDSEYQHLSINRKHCSDVCRDLDIQDRVGSLYHGWIADSIRQAIYKRDDYTCWLCSGSVDMQADPQRDDWAPSLDHVLPRSMGGKHDMSNLRTAHRWCNSVRSDSDPFNLFTLP